MAHSALHFTAGAAVAAAAALPRLAAAWRTGRPLARPFGRWLLAAYGLGLYATVPSLLNWLGAPPAFTRGWWMNLFLFHPLLTRLHAGGLIPAAAALALGFALPYALLLLAIARSHAPHPPGARPPGSASGNERE